MYKKIVYFLLMILSAGNISVAQSKQEKVVYAAINGLTKAMIDGDRQMLEKYTSDKLSYGHSGGKVEGQESFIHSLTSGASDFVTIDLAEQTISVNKKTAIVRHKLSATTNDGGKPGTVTLSILLVWQKLYGNWKLIARQAVKIV